jgi:hypothetical protein
MGRFWDWLTGRGDYDEYDEPDDDDGYDGYDDELDGDADEGVACPSFDCGCKRCALLARLCYHEAGHIVAHLALEIPFGEAYATVDASASSADGAVTVAEHIDHLTGELLIDHIVMALAGAAAENARYGGVAMSDGDDESVAAYIANDEPYGTIADLDLGEAEDEAADIVDHWGDQLDQLARDLFENGSLTYHDCLEYA